MAKNRVTLTQKLFGYYFGICITTIIILSTYSYFTAKNALISRTFDQLNSVKFEKERNIENYFIERMDEVMQISRNEYWSSLNETAALFYSGKIDEEQLKAIIFKEYLIKISPHFSGITNFKSITVETKKFSCFISLGEKLPKDAVMFPDKFSYQFDNFFKEISKVNHVSIVEDLSRKKIFIGTPINNKITNENEGVILLEIDMASINSIMFNTNVMNGLGKTGEAYVVGTDRIMRTSSRFKSNSVNMTKVKTFGVEKAFQDISATGEYRDYRNKIVLGSFGKIKIPGLNWAILVEIDLEEAMIPIYTLRNSIVILSLIISMLILGVVFVISKRISLPVLKLKQAADSISSGNYDIYVDNNSRDEIGELSNAFNQMVGKIKEQKKEIYEERSMRLTSVFDGQEQERQRLARDLHDGLGQRILAVKMQLERAENASMELKQKLIAEARIMLSAISKEVVGMSENLMPHVLAEFGLISAIENLCEEVGEIRGTTINFAVNEIPSDCSDDVKIYLYRIIQEALNNIVKHSQAKNVDISFCYKHPLIELMITDNGKGFDVHKIRKGSNGILNMRDRVDILGGTFNISSVPEKGTTIEVIIDIEKKINQIKTDL
ncbi:MAG TPA: HAMP domain-containing protein [Bacteroidales bacterium]|nr:HAMP domain-containing protein [Bacteroidales bacterium]